MDAEEACGSGQNDEGDKSTGLSSQVLDYYKRFGRHRDLEQYFSLSTVQGEVRDPSGMFWRSIKSQPDSDSGGRTSDAVSAELCRISISCTVAEPTSSQEATSASEKQDPDSPPIISEEPGAPTSLLTPIPDDEEQHSDLDTSRKSADLNLDSSMTKPHSPTSSITSQRKLEWDSLADVGYANQNERKVSSNLSTLERMALHQQFSISDEIKHDDISGHPTAHSTPLDDDDGKSKSKKNIKKGLLKKITKVSQRDVDVMEVNVDRGDTSKVVPANINFSLTKHISFNVDPKTGAASVLNSKTVHKSDDFKTMITNATADAAVGTQEVLDKEIQTTVPGQAGPSKPQNISKENLNLYAECIRTVPVFLNLDMLKPTKYRGLKYYRTKVHSKKRRRCTKQQQKSRNDEKTIGDKRHEKSIPASEITIGGSQVSETDSFEYMPAHVYHQNTARNNPKPQSNTETSNKTSSLESSGGYTTLSSKQSEHSFTRDLENSIALLNKLVQHRHQDADLKKKLVKEVVKKLIRTNYRDDDTMNDFLSGLSLNSDLIGLAHRDKLKYQTTTSTSDGNNSGDAPRQRKSILRSPKSVKSTTAQAGHVVGETSAQIHISKPRDDVIQHRNISVSALNTASGENTSKEKSTSEAELPKTSSELLYQRYLKALNREEKYKEQLKTKQEFLKHKLTHRETAQQKVLPEGLKSSSLKDIVKDLTKYDFANACGDAVSKADSVHTNAENDTNGTWKKLRNHSVFTISSGNSDKKLSPERQISRKPSTAQTENQTDKPCKINIIQQNTLPKLSKSNVHYCCCPYHSTRDREVETVIKINDQSTKEKTQKEKYESSGDNIEQNLPGTSSNKFACFCSSADTIPENFLIYKCCRLPYLLKLDSESQDKKSISIQCSAEDINSQGNISNKQLQIAEENTSDKTEKLKVESSTPEIVGFRDPHAPSSSSLKDVRVHSVPQSARTTNNVHRKFSEPVNLINMHKSNLCVDTFMQTSVSIDPKISEPTIADINVLHDDNFTSCTGIQTVDTNDGNYRYAAESFDNPLDVRHCHQLSKYNQNSKRQKETDAILEAILQSEMASTKSKDSHTSQQGFDDNLFAYLDAEKSEDSDVSASQCVTMEGMNTELQKQDKETSVTDLQKPTPSMHDVCPPVQSVPGNSTTDSGGQHRTNSREISTQVTPRDDRCTTSKEHIDSLRTEGSNRSMQSIAKLSDQNKTFKDNNNAYTADWIKGGREKIQITDNIYQMRISKPDSAVECNPDIDTVSSNGRKENEHIAGNNIKLKRNKRSLDFTKPKSSEGNSSSSTVMKEALLESIEDIIKRYAKDDKQVSMDKRKSRQRHYKDIINKLHYLLRTDNTSADEMNSEKSFGVKKVQRETPIVSPKKSTDGKDDCTTRKAVVDKATQLRNGSSQCKLPRERIVYTSSRSKAHREFIEDSSDVTPSSDIPRSSSDSFTCQIIKRIKKECEKFHHKHCQCAQNFQRLNTHRHASSSASVTRHKEDKTHHCACKSSHQCRNKNYNNIPREKKSIAYNLIIQPSDSVIMDNNITEREKRKIKDIIVKVPSNHKIKSHKTSCTQSKEEYVTGQHSYTEPTPEQQKMAENDSARSRKGETDRSKSLPADSEVSGSDGVRKIKFLTIREYLERNRPDFVSNTNERQSCLRVINESRLRQQSVQRELLSLQEQHSDAATTNKLRELARRLGEELRTRRPEIKFLSERNMKEHSRKIYKSLPEVQQRKEKLRKDQIKKTNLIMTSLFNKNLQKKALCGTVDISQYSPVIKI